MYSRGAARTTRAAASVAVVPRRGAGFFSPTQSGRAVVARAAPAAVAASAAPGWRSSLEVAGRGFAAHAQLRAEPAPARQQTSTQPATHSKAYQDLMQFVSRNKKLPAALSVCDKAKAAILKLAIEAGKFQHPIYDDPMCSVYLVYLIQQDLISVASAQTQLLYLNILAQYTTRQDLKPGEAQYKFRSAPLCQVYNFDEYPNTFEQYADKVSADLDALGVPFDKAAFFQFLKTCPPSDQTLFEIPKMLETPQGGGSLMLALLTLNKTLQISADGQNCWLPSVRIFEYILDTINPRRACRGQMVFGQVNEKTLFGLHRRGVHPVVAYHPCIESNMLDAHGRACGPVGAMLHDFSHLFMACFLNHNEYAFIYKALFPILLEISNSMVADTIGNIKVSDNAIAAIRTLNDLDLQIPGQGCLPHQSVALASFLWTGFRFLRRESDMQFVYSSNEHFFYELCVRCFDGREYIQKNYGIDVHQLLSDVIDVDGKEDAKQILSNIRDIVWKDGCSEKDFDWHRAQTHPSNSGTRLGLS
jgi:hypothetical protein